MATRRTQRTITIRPEQAVIPFIIRTDLLRLSFLHRRARLFPQNIIMHVTTRICHQFAELGV